MTKLWLGKVGALFRISKKETVSVTFDTASSTSAMWHFTPCGMAQPVVRALLYLNHLHALLLYGVKGL